MVSDGAYGPADYDYPSVLILVLMEYGLWPQSSSATSRRSGLNPCSNGIWSLTQLITLQRNPSAVCLNPCSNGIWSLTQSACVQLFPLWYVLILVLMEYGLWQSKLSGESNESSVLILVLMEYGLWPNCQTTLTAGRRCLNPCSNGIWSLTPGKKRLEAQFHFVLILVLMEYGLWRIMIWISHIVQEVLILVLMEYGLWLDFYLR